MRWPVLRVCRSLPFSGVPAARDNVSADRLHQWRILTLETSLLVGERMAFKMHREGWSGIQSGLTTRSVTSIRHPLFRKTGGDIRW
jgi:hypothetical protein